MTKYVVACQLIGNSWNKKAIQVLEYVLGKDKTWHCDSNSTYLDETSISINYVEDNYAHVVFEDKTEAELFCHGIKYGLMLAGKMLKIE